jgi:hypothetical protein
MRGVTRIGIIHSCGAIFVGALCEVERQFIVEVAIELLAAKERLKPQEKFTKPM